MLQRYAPLLQPLLHDAILNTCATTVVLPLARHGNGALPAFVDVISELSPSLLNFFQQVARWYPDKLQIRRVSDTRDQDIEMATCKDALCAAADNVLDRQSLGSETHAQKQHETFNYKVEHLVSMITCVLCTVRA